MAEIGIDISQHRSKSVTEFKDQPFDLVLTVCDAAKESCPLFIGGKTKWHHSFEDPADYDKPEINQDKRLQKFREIRDEILRVMKADLPSKMA